MPLRGRRIFGLRSGCGGYDGNPDQNDRTDDHPRLRHADENGCDRQADNENDESDQIRAERRHDCLVVGFRSLNGNRRSTIPSCEPADQSELRAKSEFRTYSELRADCELKASLLRTAANWKW